MKKQSALKIINLILFMSFLLAAIAMVLYRWGPSDLQGTMLFYTLHSYSGIFFFALIIIHLLLNSIWIKNNYFKKRRKK